MKFFISTSFLFFSLTLFAGVDPEVFIRGEILGSFTEKEVKVKDSFGQLYYLPRSSFPDNAKIIQGQKFAINVSEKIVQKIKILDK